MLQIQQGIGLPEPHVEPQEEANITTNTNTLNNASSEFITSSVVKEETKKKEMKRGVSFDQVTIREYSRCLGNNPAVTHGPPLSIDWSYNVVGTFEVEKYEANRPARRIGYQMLIPGAVREQMLLDQTRVTRTQISNRIAQVQADRHKRQVCLAMQEFEEWQMVFESLKRKIRRFRSGISKKREQEMLWENAKRWTEERQGQVKLESDTSSSTEEGSGQYCTQELTVKVHCA